MNSIFKEKEGVREIESDTTVHEDKEEDECGQESTLPSQSIARDQLRRNVIKPNRFAE